VASGVTMELHTQLGASTPRRHTRHLLESVPFASKGTSTHSPRTIVAFYREGGSTVMEEMHSPKTIVVFCLGVIVIIMEHRRWNSIDAVKKQQNGPWVHDSR
jgi:hypothetical protein